MSEDIKAVLLWFSGQYVNLRSVAASLKAALTIYVNLEIVLVFVLETDNVVEELPSFHLFLEKILRLGLELEPGTRASFSFVN